MELFPFLIFAILNLSGACLWKYWGDVNDTWHIDRGQWEEMQSSRTITQSQIITELFPFLTFAIIILYRTTIFYSFTNITLPLLHIFEEHPSGSILWIYQFSCCISMKMVWGVWSGFLFGKIFSRWHIEIFFLFSPENRIWHFMQIFSSGDTLHKISNPAFWKKWEKYHQFIVLNLPIEY